PNAVRARESVVLPTAHDGRHTHQHALWSDVFFQWMEDEGLRFPAGVNRNRVRDLAVFHHRPTDGPSHIITEADRLASGQERKEQDERAEADPAKRHAFREESLLSLTGAIDLGLGSAASAHHAALPLEAAALFPRLAEPVSQPGRYAELWQLFRKGFSDLCTEFPGAPALFEQGLLALSEQLLWAVPSSTIDQPDVPLHDHARAVAAIAACLFLFHSARGELGDEGAIHDRNAKKFRILEGDLSGIQHSLFRLKSEQVKGVNRILRARSFLIAATTEAALLLCREEIGLPASISLLSAGGRFRLLVPALEGLDDRIDLLRRRLDRWMAEQWMGDLAIILALTEAFPPSLLHRERARELAALSAAALERAKLSPLAGQDDPVIRAPYEADGACASCGVRPATQRDGREEPAVVRCLVCHQAHEIGSTLPHAVGWRLDRLGSFPLRRQASFFDRYGLTIVREPPLLPHGSDRAAVAVAATLRTDDTPAPVLLGRFIANHVPRLEDSADGRYADLSAEARNETREGGLKTFEHLAADAREVLPEQRRSIGRAMLGVVKADVDRLGIIFGNGLGEDHTAARIATLSRMLDGFFSGHLPALLREKFPDTYTVYAGGDDLLLIAPWLQAIRLAAALRADFRRFSNGNPNLTVSAAIEFIQPNEPINRAVREAERRLEGAKEAGRDRVSFIVDEPISWGDLDQALEQADQLNTLIRAGELPAGFLYRMLGFWADKEETEEGRSLRNSMWRARFSYHLARLRERARASGAPDCSPLLCRIMGLGPDPAPPAPIPISIALWRNR
ncbi:MAG: type III-A CRISPR-associated protein Cas10/Csm1, partial [Acetobacteraceae bacterium]